ncbi:H-type lectin domain-containing protein [Paracoccus benzoatiresistens]|uniref:H-type lectin domain-containing protein n=1 Tax=Paracoccus benzoatiresistens TaxID=2997341 RepID=A0ABT4J3Z3_9RHOB|nr:H-type lectin domain-containing protein [Paracoccus sp. EF6]MCZ0961801.1 H-type lectin domain-containing protein [Paracoccus sp. EF6]
MRRLSHHAVGVCQGSQLLFSAFEDQGVMWTGEGPRIMRQSVTFPEPFAAPPAVHVTIGMWDIEGRANQRADICAEQVTATGFEIVFRTWGDTKVARIRAEWLAIGAVRHDDDFTV